MDARYRAVLDELIARFEVSFCGRDYVASRLSTLHDRLVGEIGRTDPHDDERFAATVTSVLETVGMSHLALWSPAQVNEIRSRSARPPAALQWSRCRTPAVNYVRLPSLRVEAFDVAEILDVIGATDNRQSFVLDLRLNDGGSASSAGHLLGALAGPDVTFLRTGPHDGGATVVHPFPPEDNVDQAADVCIIEQHGRTEWRTAKDARQLIEGPVIVLVGERTYSMGEVLAQAIVECGCGITVGSRTAGAVVAAQEFDCGGGFELLLPFATMSSAKGVDLEGRGHNPTVARDFGDSDLHPLSEHVIDGLITHLRADRRSPR